jgi:hypothetical protein
LPFFAPLREIPLLRLAVSQNLHPKKQMPIANRQQAISQQLSAISFQRLATRS